MLGASVIVIIAFIINFWWKISIHMTAIGGMLGAFMAVTYLFFVNTLIIQILILLCSGIIGASRLQLKAHQPPQIYGGFLLGFLVMTVIFFLLT
jgi:membrane-associated phospholipid phosphatase